MNKRKGKYTHNMQSRRALPARAIAFLPGVAIDDEVRSRLRRAMGKMLGAVVEVASDSESVASDSESVRFVWDRGTCIMHISLFPLAGTRRRG